MKTFDISRTSIGFDQLMQFFVNQQNEQQRSYPPYNIELISPDNYRIVMALAGFHQSEIEIEAEGDNLLIVGRKEKNDDPKNYLHRGIAVRDFRHEFKMENHVKVTTASFDNGMLIVDLVREVPEALKPRKININGVNVDSLINTPMSERLVA
jgi:molecular chaperone IbpA